MCTGYLADHIENEFVDGSKWGVEIAYSREPHALGTGGALKLAQPHLSASAPFLMLNGDSFLQMDFDDLIRFHRTHRGVATIAVRRVDGAGRYGSVEVAGDGQVVGFREKTDASVPGIVNGGVYAFSPAIFDYIPEGQVSLEREVFPRLTGNGLYAREQQGIFIDIGIPEDYARAQAACEKLFRAARETSPQRTLELGGR